MIDKITCSSKFQLKGPSEFVDELERGKGLGQVSLSILELPASAAVLFTIATIATKTSEMRLLKLDRKNNLFSRHLRFNPERQETRSHKAKKINI